MAKFFQKELSESDPKTKVGYYSERGVMFRLLRDLIPQDPEKILDKIELTDGTSFYQEKVEESELKKLICLTEFELGKSGFGSPDGAIFIETKDGSRIWVFLVAKTESYSDSAEDPRNERFNSSINGQLELRWRLVNAIKAINLEEDKISEQNVILSDAYKEEGRRSVELNEGVEEIYQKFLKKADDFYYVAITKEDKNPLYKEKNEDDLPRLYDKKGKKVKWEEEKEHFGWYNFEELIPESNT